MLYTLGIPPRSQSCSQCFNSPYNVCDWIQAQFNEMACFGYSPRTRLVQQTPAFLSVVAEKTGVTSLSSHFTLFFPQSPFFPQSELERLNNIPEARMKRSLSTVSVYQRECLKLSSRCLHFSTRGMFQRERFVIQMGGYEKKWWGKGKKSASVS